MFNNGEFRLLLWGGGGGGMNLIFFPRKSLTLFHAIAIKMLTHLLFFGSFIINEFPAVGG